MKLDPRHVQQQITALLLQYPELADDEQFRADMIEGETDLHAFLSRLVREIGETNCWITSLCTYAKEISERTERLEHRVEIRRALMLKLLQDAGLKSVPLPEATLSVRPGQQKVIGEPNAKDLPDCLVRVSRDPDRAMIKAWLQAGNQVQGCHLSNGEPSLVIKSK